MRRHWWIDRLAVASLALAGAAASVCGRTSRADRVYLLTEAGKFYAANACPGMFTVEWPDGTPTPSRWRVSHDTGVTSAWSLTPATVWNHLGFYGGFTGSGFLSDRSSIKFKVLVVRPWPVCAACGVLPMLAIWRRIRCGQPIAGKCPTCGYDLRATPGRCPECGTALPADKP